MNECRWWVVHELLLTHDKLSRSLLCCWWKIQGYLFCVGRKSFVKLSSVLRTGSWTSSSSSVPPEYWYKQTGLDILCCSSLETKFGLDDQIWPAVNGGRFLFQALIGRYDVTQQFCCSVPQDVSLTCAGKCLCRAFQSLHYCLLSMLWTANTFLNTEV